MKITREQADEYAQQAIAYMKKDLLKYVAENAVVPRWGGFTTRSLIRILNLQTDSMSERQQVASALSRALVRAMELGLVERRSQGGEQAWVYSGTAVAGAVQRAEEKKAAKKARVLEDLRTLGLPRKALRNNGTLDISVDALRRAANALRTVSSP